LHAGTFALIGVLFSNQLEQIIHALAGLGTGALGIIAALAVLYTAYKYFQRRRLFNDLKMARITAEELHQKQQAGENPIILDLRSLAELERNPLLILGAFHMTIEEIQTRHHEIPRDRDIILYCSCPNEVSARRAAQILLQKGYRRVRPLEGGIDAWVKAGYPVEEGAPVRLPKRPAVLEAA